jgi:cell wall-associated NlpC family hydrolase
LQIAGAFFVHIKKKRRQNMLKKLVTMTIAALFIFGFSPLANAQHTVQKGDTLYKIAKQHNMSLNDIIKLNPQHPNPNMIHIGDFIITRDGNTELELVEYARSLQDVTTYVYGGQDQTPPLFTDCSGWVQHIYGKFGVKLPRVSRDQAKVGTPVKFQNMKIGDLMYFSTRADKVITHVGIYTGNDYWISNLSTKQDVEVLSTWGNWTQKYFLFAKRVL